MKQSVLNEIKQRVADIGQYDWEINEENLQNDTPIVEISAFQEGEVSYKVAAEVAMEDGIFIAHALQDVPKLVAEVERLQSSLQVIRMGIYEIEFFKSENSIQMNLIETGQIIKSKEIDFLSSSADFHVIRLNGYEIELFKNENSMDINLIKDGKIIKNKHIACRLTVEKLLNFLRYK